MRSFLPIAAAVSLLPTAAMAETPSCRAALAYRDHAVRHLIAEMPEMSGRKGDPALYLERLSERYPSLSDQPRYRRFQYKLEEIERYTTRQCGTEAPHARH